jgi:ligand-binding sensor domain-containing protein
MTVLRTMWGKVVVVQIRARRVFVLGTVLANLSLVALPRALALDPDRRISQYDHTAWRIQDGAITPPTNIAQTTDGFLWITTAQGSMHFDGVRFMPWQPPQGQNLGLAISKLIRMAAEFGPTATADVVQRSTSFTSDFRGNEPGPA